MPSEAPTTPFGVRQASWSSALPKRSSVTGSARRSEPPRAGRVKGNDHLCGDIRSRTLDRSGAESRAEALLVRGGPARDGPCGCLPGPSRRGSQGRIPQLIPATKETTRGGYSGRFGRADRHRHTAAWQGFFLPDAASRDVSRIRNRPGEISQSHCDTGRIRPSGRAKAEARQSVRPRPCRTSHP